MEWRLNHVGQMAQSVQDYSVYFISRDQEKLNSGKKHFDEKGYNKFKYKLRDSAKKFVMENKNKNNYFVFIGSQH